MTMEINFRLFSSMLPLIAISTTAMTATVLVVLLISATEASDSAKTTERHSSYGVDVSFPIQHDHVTTNYDWLPHNTLPQLYPTPEGYVDMPIQPLGNKQEHYSEYIRGCIDYYVSFQDLSIQVFQHQRSNLLFDTQRLRSLNTVHLSFCLFHNDHHDTNNRMFMVVDA